MDARYVITDSFHGTVFSILFEKPCIVIQNSSRGNDRFQSLLKMFVERGQQSAGIANIFPDGGLSKLEDSRVVSEEVLNRI